MFLMSAVVFPFLNVHRDRRVAIICPMTETRTVLLLKLFTR
jgi:hypothetical protein